MTDSEKRQIRAMRFQGMSYSGIGAVLGYSKDTIHSFCRRNDLAGDCSNAIPCKQCGELIRIDKKRQTKKFCSNTCRMAWWNSHLECVNYKSQHDFTCPACGKVFSDYLSQNRKYCSRSCYIQHRYGKTDCGSDLPVA